MCIVLVTFGVNTISYWSNLPFLNGRNKLSIPFTPIEKVDPLSVEKLKPAYFDVPLYVISNVT